VDSGDARFPWEIAAVWALFGIVALEMLVTYARLPARELYHVSGTGLSGGAGRVLVFSNWPVALVAIPILVLLAVYLSNRTSTAVALAGVVLSAAVLWPGVVDESDLDARGVNAIAAVGVAIALALSLFAAVRLRRPEPPTWQEGDWLRFALAAIALALAVPWMAADLGLSFNGVPVLGTLYQSGELRSQPGVEGLHPAVHHGHHHGMDGVLLVLSALLLSRLVFSVRSGVLRSGLGAYLALMFCYGAGNVANDFWLEQVVKRGWTTWEIPDVTAPKASVAWLVIVLAAVALWLVSMRRPFSRRAADATSPR
jgi:hypothetical protein